VGKGSEIQNGGEKNKRVKKKGQKRMAFPGKVKNVASNLGGGTRNLLLRRGERRVERKSGKIAEESEIRGEKVETRSNKISRGGKTKGKKTKRGTRGMGKIHMKSGFG